MKQCPFCAEEIQDEAIKCRFCGEFFDQKPKEKVPWYVKPSALVISFFCVGPFMLPLIIIHPHYSRTKKIVICSIIIIVSYFLWRTCQQSLTSLKTYYGDMMNLMN